MAVQNLGIATGPVRVLTVPSHRRGLLRQVQQDVGDAE
jgi:hypothetical protein